MIGQEPWPLKLGMNFTWILPRVDGQVNSGEKKELCRSTGSLKETRSRAIPLPRRTYLSLVPSQSFCRSIPLSSSPQCASILFPRPWVRVTTRDEEPLPWSLRHPRGAPKPRSMPPPKGANKRISKLPPGKEVLPGGLPSGPV